MDIRITENQIHILLHTMGRDFGKNIDRNYYLASVDRPDLEELVSFGLMRRGSTTNDGADRYYHVTDEGYRFVGQQKKGEQPHE